MLPVPAVMNRVLSVRSPVANIEQATLQLRRLGFELSIRHKIKFQIEPETLATLGWRNELAALHFEAKPGADKAQAAKIIGALLAPAKDEEIHLWLADLSAVTARRSEGEAEGVLTLAAYTDRLSKYPGDIVRHVLREWRGKWFPTWGELYEEAEALTKERIALRDRMQAIMAVTSAPQIENTPKSQELDDLRAELETLDRLEAKYPDAANPARRQRIMERIAEIFH